MTLVEILWVLPLAFLIALAVGAAGRDEPREIWHATLHTLRTLVFVVGGVALTIRVLIWMFV